MQDAHISSVCCFHTCFRPVTSGSSERSRASIAHRKFAAMLNTCSWHMLTCESLPGLCQAAGMRDKRSLPGQAHQSQTHHQRHRLQPRLPRRMLRPCAWSAQPHPARTPPGWPAPASAAPGSALPVLQHSIPLHANNLPWLTQYICQSRCLSAGEQTFFLSLVMRGSARSICKAC